MGRSFKEGDRVVYVGGGPIMAVEAFEDVDGEEEVLCRWWVEKTQEFKRDYFKEGMLVPAPTPGSLSSRLIVG